MKFTIFVTLLCLVAFGCEGNKAKTNTEEIDVNSAVEVTSSVSETKSKSNMNTKYNFTEETVADMQWMNEPEKIEIREGSLAITSKKGEDFFNNPEDGSVNASAPFLYKTVEGDFVLKALVEPDFSSQWNAAAILLHLDDSNWIKFAFEDSDSTGLTIVSVVTRGTSDDSNGAILDGEKKVWLAMARKGNVYSMHWSVDGKDFKMARLSSMPDHKAVKVGIEAQCPVGDGARHLFHYFEIEEKTVDDLRNIN